MGTTTVIQNPTAKLMFHEESKIIHHRFEKFVTSDQFREVLLKGTELIKTKGAKKWLSDDRGNSAVSQADSEWAMTTFSPNAVKAGWKFWAIVMPEKMIGQMQMKRFIEQNAEHGLTVKAFPDPDAAMKWLESC